jgi:hypothetical protein
MMRLAKAIRQFQHALTLSLILGPVSLSAQTDAAQSANAPAALDQIVLNIAPQQVVGHPLRAPARAVLLDDSGGLTTSYDLSANPLTLSVSAGTLSPNIVSDSTLFSGGIVNLLPLNIRYQGSSGSVLVTASNSTVTSSGLRVSFSGYDILEAHDLLGQDLERVYGDLPTSVQVLCSNGGDLLAATRPSVKCFFKSGGGSVKVFFDPTSDGVTDTITIALPTSGIAPGQDTLVFVLDANYQISGSDYPVTDTLKTPVEVLSPASLDIVAGSVHPDSVYTGVRPAQYHPVIRLPRFVGR